jgi:hypothetical protein
VPELTAASKVFNGAARRFVTAEYNKLISVTFA